MFNILEYYKLHNDLPFLPSRKKNEKVKKLVVNLHDKTEYVNDYELPFYLKV